MIQQKARLLTLDDSDFAYDYYPAMGMQNVSTPLTDYGQPVSYFQQNRNRMAYDDVLPSVTITPNVRTPEAMTGYVNLNRGIVTPQIIKRPVFDDVLPSVTISPVVTTPGTMTDYGQNTVIATPPVVKPNNYLPSIPIPPVVTTPPPVVNGGYDGSGINPNNMYTQNKAVPGNTSTAPKQTNYLVYAGAAIIGLFIIYKTLK